MWTEESNKQFLSFFSCLKVFSGVWLSVKLSDLLILTVVQLHNTNFPWWTVKCIWFDLKRNNLCHFNPPMRRKDSNFEIQVGKLVFVTEGYRKDTSVLKSAALLQLGRCHSLHSDENMTAIIEVLSQRTFWHVTALVRWGVNSKINDGWIPFSCSRFRVLTLFTPFLTACVIVLVRTGSQTSSEVTHIYVISINQ